MGLGFLHFNICMTLDKALEVIVEIASSNIGGSVYHSPSNNRCSVKVLGMEEWEFGGGD